LSTQLSRRKNTQTVTADGASTTSPVMSQLRMRLMKLRRPSGVAGGVIGAAFSC
jgi:hypothetical protein